MTMPTGSIAMLVYDAEQGSPIEGTPPCRPTPWPRQPSWRGHFFCPSTLGPQPPLPPSITRREGCRSRLGVVASAGAVASARSTSSPTVHRRLPTARLITSSSRTISRGPQSASSAQRRISTIIAKVGGCHARISTRKCRDEFRSAPGSRINAADGNAGLLCRPRSYATSRLRNLGKCARASAVSVRGTSGTTSPYGIFSWKCLKTVAFTPGTEIVRLSWTPLNSTM